ncbi:MAG: hypothetical protein BAJALOKI1v1_1400008 [Promethearchaeota archaeon]|nr:MAG: hypothetical protein BAJALOKI1v1_1400008 [Candidatus Lokiarchaeota archaeon]
MKIEIRCPRCEKIGAIEISEDKIKDVSRGLLAINVSEKIVCEHSFVAYVDRNLEIRDCFMADFQIELPALESAATAKAETDYDTKDFDLILIKLNFPASSIAYLLRAIISNKKFAIINDQKFLESHLENFVEYISEGSFDPHIEVIPREIYINDKKKYSSYVVLEENKLVQNEDHIFNTNEINVERTIVQKFLAEINEKSSIIILRNELEKAFTLAQSIIELIRDFKGKELQSKKIIDYLEEKHNIDIKIPYLNFLINIVQEYFGVNVPKSSEVSNFLGFL